MAGSVTTRVMEPLSFTTAWRELERDQLPPRRAEGARSGKSAFISATSGCGARDERGVKNLLAALATRGGGGPG